ncbi:hypothetical protein F2Q70_00042211 [Brassica cretica]|uniref:Uncharacterized protein n=1 Tax=Brassica cretica TaxID=69181 RepID=A0A8S9K9X8_BRACR|nr:hypothetical protein F2Q70_00042211 [Brassica cretica]
MTVNTRYRRSRRELPTESLPLSVSIVVLREKTREHGGAAATTERVVAPRGFRSLFSRREDGGDGVTCRQSLCRPPWWVSSAGLMENTDETR